ncbi:MAG: type II toxin-antitoxin system RelE/ParE family toxin [Novosphingobium sp.]
MVGYAFTIEADADLAGIVEYTRRQWGDDQARRYLSQLHMCLDQIVDDGGHHKSVANLLQPMRVLRCQHHYIYCLPRSHEPALIIAILHERMNLIARLAERLD